MIKLIDLSRDKNRGVRSIEATFMKNGELVPLRVSEEDKPENYRKINNLLEQPGLDVLSITQDLYNLMSPVAKVETTINSSYYLSNNLSIEGGILKFGDNFLEDTLSTHMLSLLDTATNTPKDEKLWKSYIRFLDNLFQNVNAEIREQLFRWMDYENKAGNGFAITDDGCIVGYRGCQGTILNPESVHTGNAIVDGEEVSGHIPNKVGSVIQMPRSEVQFDPSVGCSFGLHVGTRDYAVQWAPILLLVKVNPRDVVSVPYECDSQKMRVCEYTVLKVTDASEEHKMFHCDEDDFEDDWDNCDCYDDCEGCEDCDCCDDYCPECEEDCEDCDCCNDYCSECEEDYEDCEDYEECSGSKLTIEQAKGLINKGVYIEYDEKEFDGEVRDVYVDGFDSGIILRNDRGEYKHIKLYRVTYWEVLYDNDDSDDCFCECCDCEEDDEKEISDFVNDLVDILNSIVKDEDFPIPF